MLVPIFQANASTPTIWVPTDSLWSPDRNAMDTDPDPGLGWPPEAVEGQPRPNFFLAQMIPFDPSVNP